jgi:isopentenyl-diphosphate delta-isomerase
MSQLPRRKIEHIEHILADPEIDRSGRFFDDIQLIHRALPQINMDEVSLEHVFLDKTLQFPLLISSMTGGEDPLLIEINKNLAKAAQAQGVALAVGSQRVAMDSSLARQSFQLRKWAPKAVLLANLGAVQLNYGYGFDQAKKAVDMLEADALILHLNPLQEAIQPEGDRNFKGLIDRIHHLVHLMPVPIIIKEVGCGFSAPDLLLLNQAGVKWVDTAGRGGTSWSRVEAHRGNWNLGTSFQDWGLTTPQVLRLAKEFVPDMHLIASGGIRNAQDMLKSLILGAEIAGLAKPFLSPAMESAQAVESVIESLKREFKVGMFLLGQTHLSSVIGNGSLIFGQRQT